MNRKQDITIEKASLAEEGILLNDIWLALLDFKVLIISLAIVAAVLATFYARSITPTYLAQILVVPAQSQTSNSLGSMTNALGGLASLAGISMNEGNDEVYTSLAIFKSRKFIEQYINEEGVMPKLFANNWDEQKKSWKNGKEPTIWQAYNLFRSITTIIKNDNLITVFFEWTDPVFAAELANNSIKRLNQHIRNQTIQETEKSIYFLQQQLEQTSLMNAQQLLFNLIEEQTKNIMIANVREEYVFKVIDPAITPQSQYRPNIFQIILLGFCVGFAIGCLLAIFKNILGFNIPLLSRNNSRT